MKKRSASVYKTKVGCGNIKTSIEEENGKPIDCGVMLSKSGTCGASQVEAISRLIAILFKANVDISQIVKQLKGIRCNSPYIIGEEENLSCADAIGKAIERWQDDKNEK